MTPEPLVSIVTPSYNSAGYIEATIESVLTQDYPHIEYTIMDGGSTDDTVTITRRYEGRVRCFSAHDEGAADAINRGFQRSHGEIFAWLSADDLYLPHAIRKAVEAFRADPEIGVLYGSAFWIDASGGRLGKYPTGVFDAARLERECFICQPAAFMRSEAFARAGMLDASDHFAFDYDLWIRLSREVRFHYIEDPLALSRMHPNNKTLGARRQVLDASMRVLEKHYGYVPVQQIYAYSSHLLDRRDQFFEPVQPSITAFLMTLPIGFWINRRHPVRYSREWLGAARRGIRRGGQK